MVMLSSRPSTTTSAQTASCARTTVWCATFTCFQVKSSAESKSKDDIYKLLATVPGDEAYRPLKDGKCPFVKS